MSLFNRKNPAEEFLYLYTTIQQYLHWVHGNIPNAHRHGLSEFIIRNELMGWVQASDASLHELSIARSAILGHRASKVEIKSAVNLANRLIADVENRLNRLRGTT